MWLDASGSLPAVFIQAGLAELRGMMADPRFADPDNFAHIRTELGIDPEPR